MKLALYDAARALGEEPKQVLEFTTNLPADFDNLDKEDHDKIKENLNNSDNKIRAEAEQDYRKYEGFYKYEEAKPGVVEVAFKLVGKIKSQGTHAGGLIIADRSIKEIVPLSYRNDTWTSQWTEGRNLQLSKFGLIKFDVLGVKTLYYIWRSCELIKETKGTIIDFTKMDPTADPPYMGYEIKDGNKKIIHMNDAKSLQQCNNQKVESVFQIETPIQKSIISRGKVKSFWDLVSFNAMGRPGPLAKLDEWLSRRDDPKQKWKEGEDQRIVEILDKTAGTLCFQEDLQLIWMRIAGFTVPEAEAARKIIAKKWQEKLPQVEKKWIEGASKTIGEKRAKEYWDTMYFFGRYAFCRAHATAYSIITFRCLYLKAHYPTEWWAAVMSGCHQEKLADYMSAAKIDGVKFGRLDINNLSDYYAVRNNEVIPGLLSIKNIGEKAAAETLKIFKEHGPFENIDKVVEKTGKKKIIFERLIKLGAFDKMHPNRRGLWYYYQYEYCSADTENFEPIRARIDKTFAWTPTKIEEEKNRQIAEYKRLYPKRNKIPNKILKWNPKITISRDQIINMFPDYIQEEKLQLEKEILGYYWSSPMDVYKHNPKHTVENAKTRGAQSSNCVSIIDVIIENIEPRISKNNNRYYMFRVYDHMQAVNIAVWTDAYEGTDRDVIRMGSGIRMKVCYDLGRNSFKIANGASIIPLHGIGSTKPEIEEEEEEEILL
jgi:DNA polymerase III alpha subunit